MVRWDLKLIVKYNIALVAFSITAIYVAVFLFFNMDGYETITAMLIFSDPVMYGYIFISVMILFEKDAGTLKALAVTPLTTRRYLLSKGIAFTILATITSTIMLVSSQPSDINFLYFFLAVIFSSLLYVFIGIISVSKVRSFNQFIVVIPMILAPTALPFLNYFGITDTLWFYLIPTQACLILFKASIANVELWKIVYAVIYLLVWTYFSYYLAQRFYNRFIIKTDRNE
jgi:fluoroquinolone transport system permease protein